MTVGNNGWVSSPRPSYICPGRDMPDDEYVACYRAGHACPPYEAVRWDDDTHRHVSYRCPCCGQHGTTVVIPKDWGEPPAVHLNVREGLIFDA